MTEGPADDGAIIALEIAAARAWPAPISERLGDWWLRSADGFTGRANSVLPVGSPGMSIEEALPEISAFYRRLGQPAMIEAPLPIAAPVAEILAGRGWSVLCSVLVQVIDLDRLIAAAPTATALEIRDRPSDEHLEMLRRSRGLPPAALHVLTGVESVAFAEYRDGDDLLARARGAVTDGWLGLFSVETAASVRRRGLATVLLGGLARWGATHGARRAFLQVDTTNTKALPLYAKLGFTTHHAYVRYLEPSSQP